MRFIFHFKEVNIFAYAYERKRQNVHTRMLSSITNTHIWSTRPYAKKLILSRGRGDGKEMR